MRVTDADLQSIREEIELVENLPNGFYLYPGDNYDVTVVAQGPIDRTQMHSTKETIEMICAKIGIEADFVEKIDTPTKEQKFWLIPTKVDF